MTIHPLPFRRFRAALVHMPLAALGFCAIAAQQGLAAAATAAGVADAAPVAAPAVAPPPSAHLAFEVKGKASGINYSANARLEWEANGGHYRAFQSVRVPLLGARSQLSTGLIDSEGLQPERFEDSRRNRVLQFQPAEHTVIYHQANATSPVPANAQDRLSVFFQLASVVAADPEGFTAGRQVSIPTVTFNKHDVWVFEVTGPEALQLPAGELATLKLRRQPRKPDDQTAEIWLSPQTNYLPVRIFVREDDGDSVDLRLQKHTPAPAISPKVAS